MRRSFADADDAELDGAVRLMLAARSAGRPSDDLLDRVVAGSTAQSQTRGVGRRLGALVAAAAALAIGVLLLLNPRPAREPSSTPNLGAASTTTAAASDLELTPPPHVPDSCPVTPVTRLAGGSAPEVDMSGLRWRMGRSAWVAGIPEKIVWLPDDPGASGDVVAYATPLSVPLDPSGRIADARDRDLVVVPGNGFVGGIALPRTGCWLVTAVWPGGASSVVVSVGSRPAGATPAPNVPEPVASLLPADTCRS
ncbi:MAG TPA: hypothetical protein VFI28_07335, partial [Candidatus Limnocylindrales bacterium]|nr:hypothetical protein [Candidatus Limnocylindrales bacterium]